ncbi:acyl-CoA thioesterase [Gemella sp. GH3]|uniref:acyl-CoA thioesterase n=1 Tax=unclassified Gemella TaxID=2624949 RepID=UPI0015D0AED6|nr:MULTISPECIES: acyl-CoA thioesterase [unclassified Gemella]MBF0713815.1 acyl-CoA thioesterase [Gemella sp. GH3.1]NYS50767.1 acyl-CoA thioesterase [Gemella sp. GH3]
MNYKDTLVEGNYNIYPSYLNRHNTLFGGQILYWIDEIMGLVVRKYTSIPFVTASIDNYQFIDSVPKEDMLTLKSYVSGVGNRSMEIFVEASAFNHTTRQTRLIGICFATFSIRKDVEINYKLEKVDSYDTALTKLVSNSYNYRKLGEFSYRNFTKEYKKLF